MSVSSNAFIVQESIFPLKNLLQHQKIINKRMWKKISLQDLWSSGVAPCWLVIYYHYFWGVCCLHILGTWRGISFWENLLLYVLKG